jgi:addiction module HigA family antidote
MISGAFASLGLQVALATWKLWTITKEKTMTSIKWPHPGKVLLEDFLKPMAISQYRLAQEIGVPPRRINEIVKGQRAITADTALRLGAYFGTDAESWINLQSDYEVSIRRTLL